MSFLKVKGMKKTVLLVDDDQVVHFINRKLLETSELAEYIGEAHNGVEALSFIEDFYMKTQTVPDVIFLDINMPVMNGFMFIEQLKTFTHLPYEKIKIVLLSSSLHSKDKEMALQLGIVHYLNKPLSVQNICTLLKEE